LPLAGFGWYVNKGFVLNVKQRPPSDGAEGGFVTDWASCAPFDTLSGADNAAPYTVWDHVEYNHDFGAGVYAHGDVTLRNYRSAWNIKGLYWKTYRRGAGSGPMCDNCTFYASTPELPGGDGLVEFRNTSLNGGGVRINHHCSVNGLPEGGLCASHYLFTGEGSAPSWIYSEADGQTSALLTFGGSTRYLTGASGANVAFDASQCVPETHQGQSFVACPDAYMLRVVKIYSTAAATAACTERRLLPATTVDSSARAATHVFCRPPSAAGGCRRGHNEYCRFCRRCPCIGPTAGAGGRALELAC
jgi:hypothetical protein